MKSFKVVFFMMWIIVIVSCNDSYPKIGHYKLIQGSLDGVCLVDTIENKNGIMIIDEHILFYGYNSEFILLNQKAQDSIKNIIGVNQEERRAKTDSSTFNQFYIVGLKNGLRYGPFDKKEYLKVKNDLGIPKGLKMNYSTLEFYIKGQRNDINYRYPDPDVVDVSNLKGNEVSSFW